MYYSQEFKSFIRSKYKSYKIFAEVYRINYYSLLHELSNSNSFSKVARRALREEWMEFSKHPILPFMENYVKGAGK